MLHTDYLNPWLEVETVHAIIELVVKLTKTGKSKESASNFGGYSWIMQKRQTLFDLGLNVTRRLKSIIVTSSVHLLATFPYYNTKVHSIHSNLHTNQQSTAEDK